MDVRKNLLTQYAKNPTLAQFRVLASIADSFAKLSDLPYRPVEQRLKALLVNKDIAQFEELFGISDALKLLSERGNFKGDTVRHSLQKPCLGKRFTWSSCTTLIMVPIVSFQSCEE